MSIDFRSVTVAELARLVATRELRARELVEAAFARIDELDGAVNAFVALDREGALAAADDVDARVDDGRDVGPLAGIPIGVKDLEDAAGLRTTRGSALFAGRPPAATDSTLVARLKAAGCVVVGKTNTPEFGHKGDTVNPVFGATRNPWNLAHSAGGSSGGSAAAIAAGMVPLATASDGGGSIRIPAALCGLPGFKPSLGRVPSGGSEPPDWQHLSTKGPLAATTADTVLALDAVIGPEQSDLRSLPMPEVPWAAALLDASVPLTVAWSPTLGYATPDAEVLALCERAVRALEGLGAEVVEVEEVFAEDPVWTWVTMVSSYLLRTVEPFAEDPGWDVLDPSLRAMVELGTSFSAVDLTRAEDACHRLNVRLVELFRGVRLLVTPVTAAPAPLVGQQGVVNGSPTQNWVQYTYPFNCTRSPAGAVPVGRTEAGLPVGVQLIGPQHGDLVVLRAMAALEEALGRIPLPDVVA